MGEIRKLSVAQTHDPGRGSFMVRPEYERNLRDGTPVYCAPTNGRDQAGHILRLPNTTSFAVTR